jgi:hypothetical protein
MGGCTALRGGLVLSTFIAVAAIGPRVAFGQTRADSATAQGLFEDARKLMAKGAYAEACPMLEESQRVDPGSGTLLNLGICYEHQGRLASAWTTLLEAASAAKQIGNANRETAARQRASALSSRLGRIAIRVTTKTAGLEIVRDGAVVRPAQWGASIPADAGSHTVVATAPGFKVWESKIALKDGATVTVDVPELAPTSGAPIETPKASATQAPSKAAPAPAVAASTSESSSSSTQRTVALVAGGIGIAGVAVGTVFGLKSMAAHDDSQAPGVCSGGDCLTNEGVELTETARKAGNVSTIAFAVGAAGLVAGSILWFTAPRGGPQVGVGMGTMQLRGSW